MGLLQRLNQLMMTRMKHESELVVHRCCKEIYKPKSTGWRSVKKESDYWNLSFSVNFWDVDYCCFAKGHAPLPLQPPMANLEALLNGTVISWKPILLWPVYRGTDSKGQNSTGSGRVHTLRPHWDGVCGQGKLSFFKTLSEVDTFENAVW